MANPVKAVGQVVENVASPVFNGMNTVARKAIALTGRRAMSGGRRRRRRRGGSTRRASRRRGTRRRRHG